VKTTLAQFEKQLNAHYSENQSIESTIEELSYLTVKTRSGGHVSDSKLISKICLGKAGSLLRKYDSVAFMCAYNDSTR
jgi:hypothetical protein